MLKDNLIHYRNKKNMTQEELANKSCVSRSSIALYEKGIRKPNFETIKLICNALNISVDDLIEDRSVKRSVINFIICLFGVGLSIFISIFLIWTFILENFYYEKLIFHSFTNDKNYIFAYIFSFVLGILMYYLLFKNLKKSIKRKSILISTLPILVLFLIYSINQNANIANFIPDSIIQYVFIPLLCIYYFFILYFIVKNLILEIKYLKERLDSRYIRLFNKILNVTFICIVIASIIYVYTAKIEYTIIEKIYYEYNGEVIVKTNKMMSLLEALHNKKIFSIIFMLFQISIGSISLVNILINNNRIKNRLTLFNVALSIIFILLWTIYPSIFGDIIDEIKYIPCGFDC